MPKNVCLVACWYVTAAEPQTKSGLTERQIQEVLRVFKNEVLSFNAYTHKHFMAKEGKYLLCLAFSQFTFCSQILDLLKTYYKTRAFKKTIIAWWIFKLDNL